MREWVFLAVSAVMVSLVAVVVLRVYPNLENLRHRFQMIEVRQSRQDRETARIKTSYQASQSAPVFNSGPVTVPDIHLGMCCHLKTWDGNKHERVKALTAQGNILFSGVSGHDGASIIICFCDGYA